MSQQNSQRSSRSKSKMGNAGYADSSNSPAPSSRKKNAKSPNRAESDSPTNCISCKKQFSSLSDKMFQCELCSDNWIRISCMGISPELYAFLSQRQDLPWFCPECNGKVLVWEYPLSFMPSYLRDRTFHGSALNAMGRFLYGNIP